MYQYIIPFSVYVLTLPLIKQGYWLIARIFVLSLLLWFFRRHYKFKIKLDVFSVLIGALIFLLWVSLEGFYPVLGQTSYTPGSSLLLVSRLFSFIILTPIIEEFFTRNFLARVLISNKWKKVPLGKFTPTSFIITALFFAFSHNRWLPGLIAGILLNYLIYKRRNMSSVILAHSTANLFLAIYVIFTKSWFLW